MSDDLQKMALDCAKEINARLFASGTATHEAYAIQDAPIIQRYLERATEGLKKELDQANAEALKEGAEFNSELLQECSELRAELADARKLLSAAACPNGCRDGVIQFRDGDIGQCQWCGERNKLSANETKEER